MFGLFRGCALRALAGSTQPRSIATDFYAPSFCRSFTSAQRQVWDAKRPATRHEVVGTLTALKPGVAAAARCAEA